MKPTTRARNALKSVFEPVCFYCGRDITGKVTIDHFIPNVLMQRTAGNCVFACVKCNVGKDQKIPCRELILRFFELMMNISDEDYASRPTYGRINEIYREFIDDQIIIGTLQLWTFECYSHPAVVLNKVI